jgi:hypothetical protein
MDILNRATFRTKLLALCQTASAVFTNAYGPFEQLCNSQPYYEINEVGSVVCSEKRQFQYSVKLLFLKSRLEVEKTFQEFVEFLCTYEPVRIADKQLVGTASGSKRLDISDLVMETLGQAFKSAPNFDDREFDSILDTITSFFESEALKSQYFVFLENVDVITDVVIFGDGLCLGKISAEEKIRLLNENSIFRSRYGFYQIPAADEINAIIVLDYMDEKLITSPASSTRDLPQATHDKSQNRFYRVQNALRALRLVSPSIICHSPIYQAFRNSPFGEMIAGMGSGNTNVCAPRFIVDSRAAENLRAIHRVLHSHELRNGRLQIALKRLDTYNSRESVEDILLDIFIGFETIMSDIWGRSKGEGELRYRLAMTIAKYMRIDSAEQQILYNLIKKGYDLRSSVVHGDELNPTEHSVIIQIIGIYKELLIKWLTDKSSGRSPKFQSIMFPGSSNET